MTTERPPAGSTATFLFSDIEGSTRLEERIGTERYAERPRAASRDPARGVRGRRRDGAGHRGRLVLRRLRERPRSAVAAAVAAQRGLVAEPWPDDADGPGPDGPAHGRGDRGRRQPRRPRHQSRRADRRRSAHGGQILVSDATRALVAGALPDGVRLRDLGEVRLRDLQAPGAAEPGRCRRAAVGLPAAAVRRRAAEQPAGAADDVRRPAGGARRGGRAARADPAADADRPGRDRQDAAVDRSSRRWSPTASPTASTSWRSSRSATRCSSRRGSPPRSASRRSGAGPSPSCSIEWLGDRHVLLVLDNWEQVIEGAPAAGGAAARGART